VLFGRLFRELIRVTPVLRRAVTSTAQQAGLANPPDGWRGLSMPDVTWLHSTAAKHQASSWAITTRANLTMTEQASSVRYGLLGGDAWAWLQVSGDKVAAPECSISA
jgi:hypothetical protein